MARPKTRQPGFITLLPAKDVKIEKLSFDVENIRIGHKNFKTQEEVSDELWKLPDMDLLFDDIKKRGLEEPPIIDSNNVVLEGNRRLAVCQRLYEEQKKGNYKEHDFSKIKCREIDPSTSELDKEAFLASVHIAGKHEWPDVSQARLLKRLYEERKLSYETLAGITRKSKSTIIKKIEAYDLLLEYQTNFSADDNWTDKYPHMWELLRKDLEDVRYTKNKLQSVMRWCYEGRIPNSRDIRLLNVIFENPRALHALSNSDMKNAISELMAYDPTVRSSTYKKIVSITKLLYAFPTKEFAQTINDPNRVTLLEDLENAAGKLLQQIKSVKRGDKR